MRPRDRVKQEKEAAWRRANGTSDDCLTLSDATLAGSAAVSQSIGSAAIARSDFHRENNKLPVEKVVTSTIPAAHNNRIEQPLDPPHHQHRFTGSSLLAPSYVPENLKAINYAQVTCIIPTLELQKSDVETQRVFRGLTELDFSCTCGEKKCHSLPVKVLGTGESEFVKRQAERRKGAPIPPVAMSSGREAYVQTFRELVHLEYEETHKLFERYSQYEVKITVDSFQNRKRNPNVSGKVDGVARFRVPGIADGRPPISPGDLVFIRPHNLIRNPYQLQSFYPPPSSSNAFPPVLPVPEAQNMPYHRAEIRSAVISVTRSKFVEDVELRKDLVVVSWGVDALLTSALTSNSQSNLFTVRFVPSTITYERSLTALGWLESLHPNIAREMLFPTEVPKLPVRPAVIESNDACDCLELEYMQLNENQTKFVQMMVTRTSHPINKTIRPPLILTGPAGTGEFSPVAMKKKTTDVDFPG
jgi:hypothetical protein